jgi:hypothetical protein
LVLILENEAKADQTIPKQVYEIDFKEMITIENSQENQHVNI